MTKAYKILVVGGSWHGGNCTGLVRGFRALGHAVELIGSDHYLPTIDRSVGMRVMTRLITPVFARQFNLAILRAAKLFRPDIVVVWKGSYLKPETLEQLQESEAWLTNYYPDNSFLSHKVLNPDIFRYFNHIFTTKKFGPEDFFLHLGLKKVSFLPHGYDPHVHRSFDDSHLLAQWACDVSFIGTWSPRKEQILCGLRPQLLPGQLRIWGAQWDRCTSSELGDAIMNHPVRGDLYALAISSSKINLGLLSERREGASNDDQVTSRTFHITGCGGFLLHQRTEEVAEFFEEGTEMECFSSDAELVDKVRYYLSNEVRRREIAHAGYERCTAEHSLSNRAQVIINKYREERESELGVESAR